MRHVPRPRIALAVLTIAAVLVAVPTGTSAAPKKRKDDAAHVVTIDLAPLAIDGAPTLTLATPPDLWRAHLPEPYQYPRRNQLRGSAGKRVASRWLQAVPADGRTFHAEVFVVVEPAAAGPLLDWARRIVGESDTVYPFEDSRFDGPWIVNEAKFKLAGKKRLEGYQLENSGGRIGEDYRSVWQFALLPMRDGYHVLLGVKRRAPVSWAPGKGGPPTPGTTGLGNGNGLGSTGDGSGGTPGEGPAGDGSLGDGVGDSGGLGDVNTEPDADQVRASTELFRTLLSGVVLEPSRKMMKGERRFQLRDEWDSSRGLTSRFVAMSVPATWASTPTTALRGDRIEWIERDGDGAVTAVARVELLSTDPPASIADRARVRLSDRGVADARLVDVVPRDGTSRAALCETAVASRRGLRDGDDPTWVRDVGYVAAESTYYEVEIVRPGDSESRVETLRAILESVEIAVAY